MKETEYDDLQEALAILFEQFWVLRQEDPVQYQFIRERERFLKRYLTEKFGLSLIVHQHFIKLEKIPVEPKAWMGIEAFTDVKEYALFCCGLAFTERKSADEQFLLSDLAEEMQDIYPDDLGLDWTNYKHRKALVEVLKKMVDFKIISVVDGHIEHFVSDEQQDVLYEVTVYARYFMRTFIVDLANYSSIEAIIEHEWERQTVDMRRKRVYRKLMMSPVVYRTKEEDADFLYIRQYRHRLKDDLETYTPFKLEVFKNAALLVLPERKNRYTLYPNQKAIVQIALLVTREIITRQNHDAIDAFGKISMLPSEFIQMVDHVKVKEGHGFSKKYRDQTSPQIAEALIELFTQWELLKQEEATEVLIFYPAIARMFGNYPSDYEQECKS